MRPREAAFPTAGHSKAFDADKIFLSGKPVNGFSIDLSEDVEILNTEARLKNTALSF
jgi:hypothetical protein